MDALYRLGKASAAEIRDAIPDPPTYTAVRTMLTILNDKKLVRYRQDGVRYIYEPVVPRDQMAKNVIAEVMDTFFEGSVERIVATVIDSQDAKLTDDQIERLQAIIDAARKEGR